MRNKNRIITYLIAALVLLYALPVASSVAFYHYGVENGLTEARINSISQDSIGFIWLAGENSLTRFDGNQFKKYQSSRLSTLPWNKISTIYTDSQGTLWVGSDNGFSYYNFLKDQFSVPVSGWEGILVTDITEGKKNQLWFSTDKGLARFDKNTFQITWVSDGENDLTDSPIKQFCIQPDGKIWAVRNPGELCQINPETGEIKHLDSLAGVNMNELNITWLNFSNGRLLIGTESHGFYMYNPDEDKIKKFIVGYLYNTIHHADVENDSTIWLATASGLYQLFHHTGNYRQYTNIVEDPRSMENTTIKYVIVDRESNLWVSSGVRGIDFGLKDIMFSHFMFATDVPYCLTQQEVVCIDFDKSNNLWLGYESGLLEKHSSDPFSKTSYLLHSGNEEVITGTIYRVFEDSKNRIWAGGWQSGLQKLNNSNNLFKSALIKPSSLAELLDRANILDIIEGPGGNLWVSTNGKGVIKYNPDNYKAELFQFDENNPQIGITNNYTSDLCIDNHNNLWISSSYGLSVLNLKSEQITRYYHSPEDTATLSGNAIQAIYCDNSGLIWVGTSTGLNVFIPKLNNFKRLITTHDHSINDISSIESIKQGELWISTKSGIYCLTYKLDEETNELDYETEYFFESNGLISNSYFNQSSATEKNSLIFFGGNKGVDILNPAQRRKSSYTPPKALITDVSVYGKSTYPQTGKDYNIPFYEFEYNQQMISFRFTSLNFTNPNQQRFRYQLQGFDNQWVFPEDEKVATYTNLRPGSYRFIVETLDKNGNWSAQNSSVELKINPPIWETIPFIVFMAIFIVGSFYIVNRIRNNKIRNQKRKLELIIDARTRELLHNNAELEKINQTKDKMFSIISHDLRSPFAGVLGILELLTDQESEMVIERKNELLVMAKNSAESTFELLDNLLTWAHSQMKKTESKPVKQNLSRILIKNIELKKTSAQQKEIELLQNFPEVLEANFDRDMINTVIRNLLNNAVKFTHPGGKVEISAYSENGDVKVNIADTGIGIDNNDTESLFYDGNISRKGTLGEKGTGLGLIICREFVEKNSGKIWASPNQPRGTVFSFTLPAK
jgi:signal transduction histidine kinase/ligand-binding sensor domain-containing protein